jgi:hypothetical protein
VVEVETRLLKPADIFILNKFGQHEAEGHGFRDAVGTALGKGIPVLLGIGRFNSEDFNAFAGGLAEFLPPDQDAIRAWYRDAMATLAA